MPQRCNSCGGTYEPIQHGNSAYFHQCPPETITHAVCDPKTGEVKTPEARTPRANIRNENLKRSDDGKDMVITSEGDGTTEV